MLNRTVVTGKIKIDGHADFLVEPHVALKGGLQLQQITLDYFKPITERYQLSVQQGVLSSDALIEYAREGTNIQIKQLTLDKLVADYIHVAAIAPTEKIAKEAGKATREHSNDPTFEVKVDRLQVRNSQLGYVNRAAKPAYHVFLLMPI